MKSKVMNYKGYADYQIIGEFQGKLIVYNITEEYQFLFLPIYWNRAFANQF